MKNLKNKKGITLVKLVIIIAIVISIFFLIVKIALKKIEENSKNLEQARLVKKQESICNIGETITTNEFEITVKNMEERTRVGTSKYYSIADDYYETFICFNIDMKNITSKPQRIYDYSPDFSMYFKLQNFDGNYSYYNDSECTAHYQFEFDNFDVAKLTIGPGETVTVSPVFKVYKNIYQNEIFYLNILYGTALVKIK